MYIYIYTIIASIILTIIFYHIPNKSNFNKYYIIPLIVFLIIKYIIGDWDKGYSYTYKDIIYLISIIIVSILTIYILSNKLSN